MAVIPLGLASPQASSGLPEGNGRATLNAFLFGFAPRGVFTAVPVTRNAVGSYPAISPLPVKASILKASISFPEAMATGGIFSVALSVGLLLPAVSRHAALWSPDFPLAKASDCPIPSRCQYDTFPNKSQMEKWISAEIRKCGSAVVAATYMLRLQGVHFISRFEKQNKKTNKQRRLKPEPTSLRLPLHFCSSALLH